MYLIYSASWLLCYPPWQIRLGWWEIYITSPNITWTRYLFQHRAAKWQW